MGHIGRRPAHLWAVGLLGVLWNLVGAFDFTMTQISPHSYLAGYDAVQLAWVAGFPPVMEAGWGVGTLGGLAGSLLLLARSRHALPVFGASLLGLLVTTLYTYGPYPPPEAMQTHGATLLNLAIWAIAIALFLYARRMCARGVLR